MFKRLTVLLTCVAVLNLGSPLVAQAAVIGTLQAAGDSGRVADLSTIGNALARSEVREQMLALGVEPANVEQRIAAHRHRPGLGDITPSCDRDRSARRW